MLLKVERVTECCILGEAPHWDTSTQNLYFVDVFGKSIFKYNPATEYNPAKASVAPKLVTFIIPIDGKKDEFVVSLDNELTLISWDGVSQITIIETITIVDNAIPHITFNDAKCDPCGRLWAGTMGPFRGGLLAMQPCGHLYSFDGSIKKGPHLENLRASNGIAFNDNRMYFIDSFESRVDQLDFEQCSGTVSNRRPHFTFSEHGFGGIPDGMTVDTDGNLWVAAVGGGKILKIDGRNAETVLQIIDMPTLKPTSVAFGGPNLDELYVTSAYGEIQDIPNAKVGPPIDGAVYRITGTGATGHAGVSFKFYN